jgi:hypothetical protein
MLTAPARAVVTHIESTLAHLRLSTA